MTEIDGVNTPKMFRKSNKYSENCNKPNIVPRTLVTKHIVQKLNLVCIVEKVSTVEYKLEALVIQVERNNNTNAGIIIVD